MNPVIQHDGCPLLRGPKPNRADMAVRLQRVHEKLAPNSIAIIVSNPERTRSNDTEFTYRQSSDILYVNNFPEPNAVLVVCKLPGRNKCRTVMLVQPKDKSQETWTGIRIGPEGAKQHYGADEAYTIDKFDDVIGGLLDKAHTVYYRFGANPEFDDKFRKLWLPSQKALLNPEDILHEMRVFKTERELELLRQACAISAEAHVATMQATQPGMKEYQLQALLEFMFRYHGASYVAYGSIVASGNNACTLHYTSNEGDVNDGDLVLVDAACEYAGYASDITRTWPATGKFTDPQREIYQLVLDAQMAAIRACKPGVPLIRVHQTAARVLRNGLIKLGVLPPSATAHAERSAARQARKAEKLAKKNGAATKPGDEPKPLTLRDFFMHGTSHWMGLDVHDVGSYDGNGGSNNRNKASKRRLLEPGMVFTVEPGLYFDKDDTRVPEKYRGIGIRIEDDILVTADGYEVLTSGVPKSVEDIESLMESVR